MLSCFYKRKEHLLITYSRNPHLLLANLAGFARSGDADTVARLYRLTHDAHIDSVDEFYAIVDRRCQTDETFALQLATILLEDEEGRFYDHIYLIAWPLAFANSGLYDVIFRRVIRDAPADIAWNICEDIYAELAKRKDSLSAVAYGAALTDLDRVRLEYLHLQEA